MLALRREAAMFVRAGQIRRFSAYQRESRRDAAGSGGAAVFSVWKHSPLRNWSDDRVARSRPR